MVEVDLLRRGSEAGKVQALQSTLDQRDGELDELASQLANAKKRAEVSETNAANLQSELGDARALVADLRHRLDAQAREFEDRETRLREEFRTGTAEVLEQVAELKTRVQIAERERHEADTAREAAIAETRNAEHSTNIARLDAAIERDLLGAHLEERHRQLTGRNLAQKRMGIFGAPLDFIGNVGTSILEHDGPKGKSYFVLVRADRSWVEVGCEELSSWQSRIDKAARLQAQLDELRR